MKNVLVLEKVSHFGTQQGYSKTTFETYTTFFIAIKFYQKELGITLKIPVA